MIIINAPNASAQEAELLVESIRNANLTNQGIVINGVAVQIFHVDTHGEVLEVVSLNLKTPNAKQIADYIKKQKTIKMEAN